MGALRQRYKRVWGPGNTWRGWGWSLSCPGRKWILRIPSQAPKYSHKSSPSLWTPHSGKPDRWDWGDQGRVLIRMQTGIALSLHSSGPCFHWAYCIRLLIWILWPLVITENTMKKKNKNFWYWGNSHEGVKIYGGGRMYFCYEMLSYTWKFLGSFWSTTFFLVYIHHVCSDFRTFSSIFFQS